MATNDGYTVNFPSARVLVYLAGAGSGKTESLMRELSIMLKTYRPDEIALTTFTRKGVHNAVARALQINPSLTPDDLLYFQTMHKMCYRALGYKRENILTQRAMDKFNAMLGFSIHMASSFDNQSVDDQLLQRYDAYRGGSSRGVFSDGIFDEERYTRLVCAYEEFKKSNGLIDFFDCLQAFKDRNESLNVKVMMADECQDMSLLQWDVFQIMGRGCKQVYASGDDFQGIFSYLGSRPDVLIDMANRFETIKLEKSYRLPKKVYEFARGITSLIQEKVDKDYAPATDNVGFVEDITDRSALCRVVRKDGEECGYKSGRWYFLFRVNCFIQGVTKKLEDFVVPYHTQQGFCIMEEDLRIVRRYYNFRKKGFSTHEIKKEFALQYNVKDFSKCFTESNIINGERRFVVLEYVKKFTVDTLLEMSKNEPFLLLSTVYKVKGGEADLCAFFLDATKLVHANLLLNLDEELRVMYVACTRSKKGLYLVKSESTNGLDSLVDTIRERL